MGEEYVTRIIVFGGMVHGIAVSLFLTSYGNPSLAGNVMDAIAMRRKRWPMASRVMQMRSRSMQNSRETMQSVEAKTCIWPRALSI